MLTKISLVAYRKYVYTMHFKKSITLFILTGRALKNIEANFKVDKKQRGKLERKIKVHKTRKFKKWKKKVRENGDRKELISGNKIVR